MSNINIKIPHQLSKEEAIVRIKKLLADLQREQKDVIKDVSETWNGNEAVYCFTAKGFDISGNLRVESDQVIVQGKLPLVLSFFKGKISQAIEEKAEELLSS